MFKKIFLFILGVILSLFSFLEFKKSMNKTENIGYTKFLSGNKLVEENKIKEAIEEYKLALDNNNDINIKKNYELALKQQENQQQSDQQDQNKKDNQEQNKNQQQSDQENGNNNENKNNQSDQNNNENNSENNKQTQSEQQQQDQQKADELKSIMQRLEGNEKRAFKNNERVLNMSEDKNSENRW